MRDVVPQGNHMNPAFFPDGKFYVSLPAISGVSFSLNNAFAYSDLFTEIPGEDSVQMNVDNLLSKIGPGDFFNVSTNISLFQFGIRLGDKNTITLFANERMTAGMLYPRDLLDYAWRGNGDILGETFTEKNLKTSVNAFREIGLGYSRKFRVLGDRSLIVGVRVKTLQGNIHVNSSDNLSVDILTNTDRFDLNINVNDPVIRTAGLEALNDDEIDAGSYFGSNSNKGFGFDFGADIELTDKINITLAVNDIGSIRWKEALKNYRALNTSINYEGIDLKDLDDVTQVIEDTLSNKFQDTTNINPFSTSLNTRTFLGGSYRIRPNSTISASISNVFILDKPNTSIGVGFTQQLGKILTASATLSKKPGQTVTFGGGFAVRLGFFQMYTTVGNILGYSDVRNLQNVDFRFGINFVFGRHKPKELKPKEQLGPFPDWYVPGYEVIDDGIEDEDDGLF